MERHSFQTRNLGEIMVLYAVERSYANCILQVSIDRIIDIFVKRKNWESFMQSVHALIILLYIGWRRLIQ